MVAAQSGGRYLWHCPPKLTFLPLEFYPTCFINFILCLLWKCQSSVGISLSIIFPRQDLIRTFEKSMKAPSNQEEDQEGPSCGQRQRTRDMEEAPVSRMHLPSTETPAVSHFPLLLWANLLSFFFFFFALLGFPDPTLIFLRTHVPFISDSKMLQTCAYSSLDQTGES